MNFTSCKKYFNNQFKQVHKKRFYSMQMVTCREAGTMTPGVSCPWPELTAPTTRQMFSTAVPTWGAGRND